MNEHGSALVRMDEGMTVHARAGHSAQSFAREGFPSRAWNSVRRDERPDGVHVRGHQQIDPRGTRDRGWKL